MRRSIARNDMGGVLSSSDHASLPFFLLRFGRFREADIAVGQPGAAAPADDETLLLGGQSGGPETPGLLFLRYSRSVLSVWRPILSDTAVTEELGAVVCLLVPSSST